MGVLGFKAAVVSLVLAALLVGCEKKKDLSPPPVNASASDAIKIAVVFDDPDASNRYKVSMKAEYGNMALECSNVKHLQGGWVDYPHGYVDINSVGSNEFLVYRDHFEHREKCSWNLFGVGVDILDSKTGGVYLAAIGATQMVKGFEQEQICEKLRRDTGAACMRKEIVHVPGDLKFKFRIN